MSAPNDTTIPFGYCHCGCGQKTNIAPINRPGRNWTKGQPQPFVAGHGRYLPKQPLGERFWSKIDKGNSDDCWLWLAATDEHGYGDFILNRKHIHASRLAYILTFGDISKELDVCHSCDNPPCCNPTHLFTGTTKDNMQDMIQKGRAKHWRNIPSEVIAEIRELHASGQYSQGKLAKRFGVSQAYIHNIVRGKARRNG